MTINEIINFCTMYYTHIQVIWLGMYGYMYSYTRIPGGQKSQSGNQVAVNTDWQILTISVHY